MRKRPQMGQVIGPRRSIFIQKEFLFLVKSKAAAGRINIDPTSRCLLIHIYQTILEPQRQKSPSATMMQNTTFSMDKRGCCKKPCNSPRLKTFVFGYAASPLFGAPFTISDAAMISPLASAGMVTVIVSPLFKMTTASASEAFTA